MKLPFKGAYRITQKFGENPDIYKKYGFAGHEGIDIIPLDNDFEIHCIEGGEVIRDIDTPRDNYGNYILIWNQTNKRGWWYCHLAQNFVSIGDRINKGTKVGMMGDTGFSTGPHLHLGLRYGNENKKAINTDNGYKGFVDPLPTLREINDEEVSPPTALRDTPIDWDDEEGNRHEVNFYVREWFNEKEQNVKLAEEVAKWREMQESCQAQVSTMAQEATERIKMIDNITSQLKTKEGAILELQGINKTMSDENEILETKVENLQKKNDLKQYSVVQFIFETFSRIKRGDKNGKS